MGNSRLTPTFLILKFRNPSSLSCTRHKCESLMPQTFTLWAGAVGEGLRKFENLRPSPFRRTRRASDKRLRHYAFARHPTRAEATRCEVSHGCAPVGRALHLTVYEQIRKRKEGKRK